MSRFVSRLQARSAAPRNAMASAITTLAAVLALGLAPSAAAQPIARDVVPVPGGTAAMARLLGSLDEEPERFVGSLNHLLLATLHEGDRWEDHPTRSVLAHYLEDLERLEAEFSASVTVAEQPKPLRKRFRQLCEHLGYDAKVKKGKLVLVARADEAAARRHRLANALGWDLPGAAEALNRGERVTFEIPSDQVSTAVPLSIWEEALNRRLGPAEALSVLARNQRLGLLLAGSRRLSRETFAALDRVGWRWLYQNAAPQLYRYGAAIRVEAGRLQLPGGEGAATAWEELVEERPDQTTAFLRALLTRKNGQAAFLWQALAWTPPPVVQFYLGGAATTRPERKFIRKLYRRLDETTRQDFDKPRGGDLGFGTFVRSIPLTGNHQSLALPGGLGLWFVAIRDDESPGSEASLDRLVQKGLERQLEEDEFLLRSLDEHVQVRGARTPVLPRLIRTSHSFSRQPELLTPRNIILLARASDNYPAVLGPLDEMRLRRPEVVTDYLLAVAHLDSLGPGPDTELLLLNFQGGVEWLRALSRAGKVADDLLEEKLRRWSRLHRRAVDPFEAAPAQLGWIRSLLETLPEAPPGAPGRGPYEKRFIQALVEAEDPQAFSWKGLDYRGNRGEDLAKSFAAHLDRQQLPSADDVRAIHLAFAELERATSAGEVAAAGEAVTALRRTVGRQGGERLAALVADRELAARMLPVDRQELDGLLARVAKAKKPKRLNRQLDDVIAARQLLARELRPFLLGPAYLLAMGEADSVLLDDPNLARKHLFADGSPWRRASVKRIEGSELGAHISGHLGSIAEPLAGYSLIGIGGSGAESPFRRTFYQDYISTRWTALTVDVNRAIAAAATAGREVRDRALEELESGGGEALDFVAARVPWARFSGSRGELSPSELVMIGLAALAGDAFSARGLDGLEAATRQQFERARSALGDGWRERVDSAGSSTTRLNGRSTPWIGTWPPYEAAEVESRPEGLFERLVLDLKLAIIDYLGRNDLPGVAGRDLMGLVLPAATSEPRLDSWRDWQGYLRWLRKVDDNYLDDKLRECMRQGLYTIEGF